MKIISKLRAIQLKLAKRCLCHYGRNTVTINRRYSNQTSEPIPGENIRNFCIIAHIDHGKSTLADRFLEITGAIDKSVENKQVLDRLPVEKERGITVKAVAASLTYTYNNTEYLLNLIDTPGHVDFCNEVSRSLSASQGVILLVDANQGIQAQTVANFFLAFARDLTVIPVLNKIDLKNAKPEKVESQLFNAFDIEPSTVLRVSAKTGLGIEDVLKAIIERIPPPKVNRDSPFRALLIDSWFENLRGVLLFVYAADGKIRVGQKIKCKKLGKTYEVRSVGILTPGEKGVEQLSAGEMGVISCKMRNLAEAISGDTVHDSKTEVEALPSFKPAKSMVFAGLFPINQSQQEALRNALQKLLLNDPAVSSETFNSPALGCGWQLGFLGLLHLDVFRQRLEQEFGTEAVLTAPSVTYKVKIKGAKNIKLNRGDEILVCNPVNLPDPSIIEEIKEPMVIATIISPMQHFKEIAEECSRRRGVEENSVPIDNDRMMLTYRMPLKEIIMDFHDKLKSLSSGYASFDYEETDHQVSPMLKMSILLNGRDVEEMSTIVHAAKAQSEARRIVLRLKESIPRQQVLIAIQAAVGKKVLAREDIKPYRKDVTQGILFGGDMTRRQKLLHQQVVGKKKMRAIANIMVPRDTFIEVLKQK